MSALLRILAWVLAVALVALPVVVGQVADLAHVLPDVLQDGDLLLMMGAGDIGYVAHQIATDGFGSGAPA